MLCLYLYVSHSLICRKGGSTESYHTEAAEHGIEAYHVVAFRCTSNHREVRLIRRTVAVVAASRTETRAARARH